MRSTLPGTGNVASANRRRNEKRRKEEKEGEVARKVRDGLNHDHESAGSVLSFGEYAFVQCHLNRCTSGVEKFDDCSFELSFFFCFGMPTDDHCCVPRCSNGIRTSPSLFLS